MLEVALARRMCCSRACSVSVKPSLPALSSVRPTMRPGICRTYSLRVVMKPKYGPPEDSGTPSGWPSPTAMSAPRVPHSPGGFSSASEGGLTTAMTSAWRSCAQTAEEVRLLDDERGDVLTFEAGKARRIDAAVGAEAELFELQALVGGRGERDLAVVRMHAGRHQDPRRVRLAVGAHRHQGCFRHGGGAVVHRGVGDRQPGEARHHGLELVDELQRALARFGLV